MDVKSYFCDPSLKFFFVLQRKFIKTTGSLEILAFLHTICPKFLLFLFKVILEKLNWDII